jgi:acetyl-CoA C-acetyltransferase
MQYVTRVREHARITASLLNNLTAHDKQFGLETMCVGGGQGMAMVLERLS